MFRLRAVWLTLACLGLSLCGGACGLLRKRPVKRDDSMVRDMLAGRRPIGQITMLDRDHDFVLFRSPLPETVKEATLLVAKDKAGNTTGKLKVSPEKKRTFLAADIAEGSPKLGDVVFVPSDKTPVSTAPPPETGKRPASTAPDAPGVPPAAASAPGSPDGSLPPLGQPSGPPEALPEVPELPEAPR